VLPTFNHSTVGVGVPKALHWMFRISPTPISNISLGLIDEIVPSGSIDDKITFGLVSEDEI